MGVIVGPCECCEEGEALGVCRECGAGFFMPECFELVVAGITDDECSECEAYNGTFILRYQPGAPFCQWHSDERATCGAIAGEAAAWRLFVAWPSFGLDALGTQGHWINIAGGSGQEGGDCQFSVTMDYDPTPFGSECANFPAQLTVEPIACP